MAEAKELCESVEDHDNPCGDGARAQFSGLYKFSCRDMEFSQEKKRRLFLQQQKEKRFDFIDQKRNIDELFAEETMECESTETGVKPKSRRHPFSCKLMRSEWLTELPEDLAENWYIKLCPEGVRYLVVAADGITTCYLRNGRICSRFKSLLPGGNTQDKLMHRFTVLDCIYSRSVNVIFIYDVLAWNSMSLVNADAQMRFYWLRTKFQENPEMLELNSKQNFKFVLMDSYSAEKTVLQERLYRPLTVFNITLPYEGVLFYHKEGQYVFGNTPLVGWLKSFMLPELIDVEVPEFHMRRKPADYQSIQQHLGLAKKKKKPQAEEVEMEILNTEDELIMEIMKENAEKMVESVLN